MAVDISAVLFYIGYTLRLRKEGLEMSVSQKERIYDAIKTYFEEDEAHYDADEENKYFLANYTVGNNDCSISSARLHLLAHDDGFTARFAIRGINAITKAQPYVAVLLSYINDGMRYGNFEMDMDDGEVAFKVSSLVPADSELNYEYFDRIVCLGLVMLHKYADALVPIMLGYSYDPKAAYESCINEEDR